MKIRKLKFTVYLLCAISVWEFASVAYIHAKAELAQYLVEQAWSKNINQFGNLGNSAINELRTRPWPWADTWPVARLIFPELKTDQIVLAGATGSTLAFGPGWMKASALPGSDGVSIVAAHRDTHFSSLKELQLGSEIHVESGKGVAIYKVINREVVDSKTHALVLNSTVDQLLLVTCYPFNAISNGGSLRYLVTAEKQSQVFDFKEKT